MEPIKPMDIVKQNELADEVRRLTTPEQKKRMLKDCLSLFSAKAIKEAMGAPLGFNDKEGELRQLLKEPEREDKIISLASAEQQEGLLKTCLCMLTGPEFKRLLYAYAGEVHEFNRLIREAGGRTVVPYEID